MVQNNSDDDDEVARLTESLDLPHRVCISQRLSEQLKPNEFIAGLGIQYLERIKTVLGILKGNMILKQDGKEAALPQGSIIIPLSIAKGPYIREELISIRAEVTDDGGDTIISLAATIEE